MIPSVAYWREMLQHFVYPETVKNKSGMFGKKIKILL